MGIERQSVLIYNYVERMHWCGSTPRFPRGEAVIENGSSEPFSMTEEECGQNSFVFASFQTSTRTLDFAVPLPSFFMPTLGHEKIHLPPGGRDGFAVRL